MKLFNHIVQAFKGSKSETDSEYVPDTRFDWREPLLVEAARKHGKPFKCAGGELPREIMLGGKDLVVIDCENRILHGSVHPTATSAHRKRGESALARLAGSGVLMLDQQQD